MRSATWLVRWAMSGAAGAAAAGAGAGAAGAVEVGAVEAAMPTEASGP
jgi:hypothetical protein